MATVSKNWKFELNAALNAEVAAMATGAFNLVAAAAVSYIERVYWTVPAVRADDVTKSLHLTMDGLGYSKSSKYELANAALQLARNWTKRFGAPNAAELNVFWATILAAETYADMSAFVITAVKAEYKAETMRDLYHALNPSKGGKGADKTLAERVKASMDKADANDASAAALVAVPFLSSTDKVTAFAAMVDAMDADALRKAFELVNARMAALNEAAAKANVQTVEERGEELANKAA